LYVVDALFFVFLVYRIDLIYLAIDNVISEVLTIYYIPPQSKERQQEKKVLRTHRTKTRKQRWKEVSRVLVNKRCVRKNLAKAIVSYISVV
jgi:hypothetical protein